MFTVSRKDLVELLTLFQMVEDMSVEMAAGEHNEAPATLPLIAVLREEEKVMRRYYREDDHVIIENNADEARIVLDADRWHQTAQALFEALRANDDENLVLVDDAEEAFLDEARIFCIAGTAEGRQHLLLETAFGIQAVEVWWRCGAFPMRVLDGGRSANLKFEQTGTRFAAPMAAKVNALETAYTIRDRMLLVESMGSTLKYSNVADKVFRANLSLIDLHMGRLLAEMVRLSYMEDIFRIDELTERMNELNPLKVKTELIEKHRYYEYKMKQLLLACVAGMRPAKIYKGCEDLPPYLLVLNPNGKPTAYAGTHREALANFLLHHTRLERGSMEKDKYGELERENNVYYFKLNLKIALTKR